MKIPFLFLALCLLLPRLASAGADGDVVLRQTRVPAWPPYQGEVRVVRRGEAQVVQTLLYSRFMKLVVDAIEGKESRAWPKEREGYQDSRRYLEGLAKVYRAVQERSAEKRKAGGKEVFLQLGIDFVLEGDRSYVALYAPALSREGGDLVLHGKEQLKTLPMSRDYVRKNMRLIVQDSFRIDADQAAALLRAAEGP